MSKQFDQKELLNYADALVSAARAAGADAADAIVARGQSESVSFRLGKIESVDRSEGNDAGLRVLVGQRQAIVSSNQINIAEAEAIAARAVEMAKASPEDPFAGLADPKRLADHLPDLDLLDDTEINTEALEMRAQETEDAARAHKDVTNSNGASASASLAGITLVSSHGFQGQYLRSGHSTSCSVLAGSDTAMETDYDYASAVFLDDLIDGARIGQNAAERVVRRLNPRTPETCKLPVIYEPRVAASLMGHFSGAINGASIARQSSFLKDKMEQQVFSSQVTIVDNPLRRRGLRSRPFDGEGVATGTRSLVIDGALQSWLLDSATARELGLETTGHAGRSVASPPSPGASNLHMEAGTASPEELIAAIKEGFYVTDLIGQGVNGVTGDYSRGAAGFWIENGELTYPVSQATIAGNLIDMFLNLTPASDLEFRYATNAPTILIEGMTIAGR